MNKNKLPILFISLLLVFIAFSQMYAADILSGRVYVGNSGTEPPNSSPIYGVTLRLYGANDPNNLGVQIGMTTTDSTGWYGLTAPPGYEYYSILESVPAGYYAVDATSVSGTKINNTRIRYSIATAPLSDQTLTGNKFWIKPEAPPNRPPVANADGPYTGKVGQPVTLDGSASYDPDAGDHIVSYAWDLDNDGQYDDATGVTPQHTWNNTYSGIIWLRVTDTFGETDIDSTSIRITEDERTGSIRIIKSAAPPDSGVIFNFTGDLGNFTLTPTSNQRLFTNLSPRTYTITESMPADWAFGNYQITGDLDGGTSHDSSTARFFIDLDAGEDIALIIYNYKQSANNASVGDRVWHDLDQDGLQDANEPGLDSVQVSLFDQNGNLIAQTLTTSTGFYLFSNITPGSYFIRFTPRSGFIFSPPNQGTNDAIDSDAQPASGDTPVFTLAAGANNTNMDAGMYRATGTGEISGTKWNDLNGNGQRDGGEPGLANWQIILDANHDGILNPTPGSGDLIVTTNSSGEYQFTGLSVGGYAVGEILQPGWQETFPDSMYASHAGNVGPYDHYVIVAQGQRVTNVDFGNIQRDVEYDFGDAPDSTLSPRYSTLLANNGARHVIIKSFHLGVAIDADPNGYPAFLSNGDDLTPAGGTDDEDGVTMSPFIAPGQAVPITVVASDTGVLNAWIDFNINFSWADAGEHIFAAIRLYPGANALTIQVPGTAKFGLTYARFRFSSVRQLGYDGPAPDGEVEDYAIEIKEPQDGSIVVIKEATPADNTPFLICQQFSSGFFNMLCGALQDPLSNKMTILNPGNVISISEAAKSGWSLQDITVTGDLDNGSTIDKANGKVDVDFDPGENIVITFKNQKTGEQERYDFGDAPDPSYPTLLANNGARHLITPNLYLGSAIDPEPDGQPSPMADGDDKNVVFPGVPFPTGDEDGVQIPPVIVPGSTIQVKVIASANGALNAWLDFNNNGSWADAGEHIIAAQPVVAGVNPFTINVPTTAQKGQSYARFRLSSVRNLSFDGPAPDGEVEDYPVAIATGDGGSLKIIKEATPKDDTPFWISVVYGAMGGAAPYRDPSNNTSVLPTAPSGMYYMGESIPAGWTLADIVVTGDTDNGSHIDVGNAKVDIDLDAGENITVVFKNRKSEEKELFDLGDAPDGTNHSGLQMDAYPGVPANFPTVHDAATGTLQGPLHLHPREQAYLGRRVSLELDADVGPDEDPTNNIIPQNNRPDCDYHDDGVILPLVLPNCASTSFEYRVTVVPAATKRNFYVNIWFDWNRDGDWEDKVPCSAGQAPEWAVQNQVITLGPGVHLLSTPAFLSTHPAFTGTPPPVWMRIMITTLASDTDDGSGPANGYPDGETEDYIFIPRISGEVEYDFGDAPDNPDTPGYPTLHANGGAYHDIIDGFHLGGLIDGEINGQPSGNAMEDDNIGLDDEDGVFFTTPLIVGQPAAVEVIASEKGVLNAWIDYNHNQSWMEADEHIFIDVTLNPGNNPLNFNIPSTAAPGPTFARFRLSRMPGVLSTGYGHAGEVEDYEVVIDAGGEGRPMKWRQIPLFNEDPDMPYTPYIMGWDVRSVYDGTFVADDWFCKSPRPVTSIAWVGSYTNWDSAFPPPIAPHAFHIGIWTDVPKGVDADWSHPGEMVWERIVHREMLEEHVIGDNFHPEYMSKPDTCFRYDYFIPEDEWFRQQGDSTIYWLSISALYDAEPDSFVWGWKTRYHYFHDDAVYVYDPVKPTVGSLAGKCEPLAEGWDMVFMLGTDEYFMEFDFGDAPFERYPTFFGQNGALHIYNPKVYLGKLIDTELTGQPDHTATGDDNTDLDDEDGITFTAPIGAGQITTVEVTASCRGYLNAWMDFNNNGSWADPGEQIFKDELISGGQSYLPVQIPGDAVPPPIFSRFRFSTEPGLYFVGIAIDGEVEDYYADYSINNVEAPQNDGALPTEFKLMQNFPNPFNPVTEIRYDIPKSVLVRLTLYNLSGQEIAVLVNEQKSPGSYTVKWNGMNKQGQTVAAGIYLYRIEAGDFTGVGKLLLLK